MHQDNNNNLFLRASMQEIVERYDESLRSSYNINKLLFFLSYRRAIVHIWRLQSYDIFLDFML